MKEKILILGLFLSTSICLFGQENEEKENINYSNITEAGFITASPKGISLEVTTVHGISLNKQHHFGLGVGMGINFYNFIFSDGGEFFITPYMPIFANYRCYFRPQKPFSPHINVAMGGFATIENAGIYSSLTMGFKAGRFSFSSGLSFMAIEREVTVYEEYFYSDPYSGYVYPNVYGKTKMKWTFPFGITLKCGFTF
jgi:hypothetical protein